MLRSLWPLISAATLLGSPVVAMPLDMPGTAKTAAERLEPLASYELPVGPYSDGTVEAMRTEGALAQRAWRIEESDMTTLQILDPLRSQLTDAGFELLFECEARKCGGFDFRFETDNLPEPEMHVDLGDYRFLSARKGEDYVSLLVSRSARVGFVQITEVVPQGDLTPVAVTSTKAIIETPNSTGAAPNSSGTALSASIGVLLQDKGITTLDDLTFETGSSRLGAGNFQSLSELAVFLNADGARRVVLVGHTDAVGTLEGNIALSKRRADSVAERLVTEFGVRRDQIRSEGVGYLSPRASNETAEGRDRNRRVEVVLTSLN